MRKLEQPWRLLSAQERAAAYSPSSMLGGPLDPFIEKYRRDSDLAHRDLGPVDVVAYGDLPSQSFDLFRCTAQNSAPCHVFIHGGYWQQLGKAESAFAASGVIDQGAHFIAVDYTLAPQATVQEIVDECAAALAHIMDHASDDGIDPKQVIVSGSSAGAHLAAMASLALPKSKRPAGLVLLSGVYDLEPLVGTYINDALGMSVEDARSLSPALQDLAEFPTTLVAWGENETEEFKRQSRMFASLLRESGCAVYEQEIAGRNHFDIVHDLTGDTTLARAIADHLTQN